jgi:hypothetical protein
MKTPLVRRSLASIRLAGVDALGPLARVATHSPGGAHLIAATDRADCAMRTAADYEESRDRNPLRASPQLACAVAGTLADSVSGSAAAIPDIPFHSW